MAENAQARKRQSLSLTSTVAQKPLDRYFGRVGKRGGSLHSFLRSKPKSFRVRDQWSDHFTKDSNVEKIKLPHLEKLEKL